MKKATSVFLAAALLCAVLSACGRTELSDGVEGDIMTATIVWSSSNYEYMLIDGVQYDPIQTEGNSTFEIPVVLDTDMNVSALTIAMSEPHLVDYTRHFDSSEVE